MSLGVTVTCASSPLGWWQLPCLTLGYSRIWWGRAWSPPRRFSPHAYSHQEPSFLLLLLLGAHILWHHLPAPSVISHASSNDAFPGPDSPAGMEILPFPPQTLSHLHLPAEPPQRGRRVGSKHHSSTHQARVSLENIYIFVR